MVELVRCVDPVILSLLQVRLSEAGVKFFIFDGHASGAYAGALNAVVPRIMVDEADAERARRILREELGDDGNGL